MADNPLLEQFKEKAHDCFGSGSLRDVSQKDLHKGFTAGCSSLAATRMKNVRGHNKHKRTYQDFLVRAVTWVAEHEEGFETFLKALAVTPMPTWADGLAKRIFTNKAALVTAFEQSQVPIPEATQNTINQYYGNEEIDPETKPQETEDGMSESAIINRFLEGAGRQYVGVAAEELGEALLRDLLAKGMKSYSQKQLGMHKARVSMKDFYLFLIAVFGWVGKHKTGLMVFKEVVESAADRGLLPKWSGVAAEAFVGTVEGAREGFELAGVKPDEHIEKALATLFGETSNGDNTSDDADELDAATRKELGDELLRVLRFGGGGSGGDGGDGSGNAEGGNTDPQSRLNTGGTLFGLFMLDSGWDALELPRFNQLWTRLQNAMLNHPTLALELPNLSITQEQFRGQRNNLLDLREQLMRGELAPLSPQDEEAEGLSENEIDVINRERQQGLNNLQELRGTMRDLWGEFDSFFFQCELVGGATGLAAQARKLIDRVNDFADERITDQMRAGSRQGIRNGIRRTRRWVREDLPRHIDSGIFTFGWIGWGTALLTLAWVAYSLLGALGFYLGTYGLAALPLWAGVWAAWIIGVDRWSVGREASRALPEDADVTLFAREGRRRRFWLLLRTRNRNISLVLAVVWPLFILAVTGIGAAVSGSSILMVPTWLWFWTCLMGMLLFLVSFLWIAILIEFSLRLSIMLGQGLITTGGGIVQQGVDMLMQAIADEIDDFDPPNFVRDQITLREASASERPMLGLSEKFSGRGGLIAGMLAFLTAWTGVWLLVMLPDPVQSATDLKPVFAMVTFQGALTAVYLTLWVVSVMVRVTYPFAFLDDFGGGKFEWKGKRLRRYAVVLEWGLVAFTVILLAHPIGHTFSTWAFGNQALSSECKTYSDAVAYADKHGLDMDHPDVMKCEAAAEHYTNEAAALLDGSQKKRKEREARAAK